MQKWFDAWQTFCAGIYDWSARTEKCPFRTGNAFLRVAFLPTPAGYLFAPFAFGRGPEDWGLRKRIYLLFGSVSQKIVYAKTVRRDNRSVRFWQAWGARTEKCPFRAGNIFLWAAFCEYRLWIVTSSRRLRVSALWALEDWGLAIENVCLLVSAETQTYYPLLSHLSSSIRLLFRNNYKLYPCTHLLDKLRGYRSSYNQGI